MSRNGLTRSGAPVDDFDAVTRTQDPKGAVQTVNYDYAARIDRITNQTNGAYTRHVYAPSGYIDTYTTYSRR